MERPVAGRLARAVPAGGGRLRRAADRRHRLRAHQEGRRRRLEGPAGAVRRRLALAGHGQRWGSPTTPPTTRPIRRRSSPTGCAGATTPTGPSSSTWSTACRTRTACSATAWWPTRPTSSARTACSPTTTTATTSPTSTRCWRTRWATCSARSTSTGRRPRATRAPATSRSGYLGVRNRNAVRGGTTDLPCIMRGSNATLNAFRDRRPLPLDGRPDGPAGQRRRHAAGRGGHAAGLLHAARVDRRGRRRDAARHGDGAAPSTGPHQRRRLLPQGPEHQGAARGAVPGGRRRLAAAHRHRRRVRRAVGGMDADDRATRRRVTTTSSWRRRPARRPAGPGTCGPAPRRSRSSWRRTRPSPGPP